MNYQEPDTSMKKIYTVWKAMLENWHTVQRKTKWDSYVYTTSKDGLQMD